MIMWKFSKDKKSTDCNFANEMDTRVRWNLSKNELFYIFANIGAGGLLSQILRVKDASEADGVPMICELWHVSCVFVCLSVCLYACL